MRLAWPFLLLLGFWIAPLSAAEPEVILQSRARRPGEVLLVAVRGQDPGYTPTGLFDQTPLAFFPAEHDAYLAFVGLDLEISTGTHRLQLQLRAGGKPRAWEKAVAVKHKSFPTQRVRVVQKYVTPEKADEKRAERETKRLHELLSKTTQKRFFEGNFISPIPSAPSSRFGERRIFNGVPKAPHGGADLRARSGTPVRAPAGGKVVLAKNLFYAGDTVVLDHGFGLFSYYGHLSKILVKKGQIVAQGATLGDVGATGRVTGPHLHWSVRVHEARVDPFSLVALDLSPWFSLPMQRSGNQSKRAIATAR